MSGNAYSSPPSKRLRDNASPKAQQRAPPSTFHYHGNHQNSRDHLPASRPGTQETQSRVEPARAPRGTADTQRYHSSLDRDVWSFKDESTIEAGRQSPPSGHASSDELPSVVANAVPHALLSPEQHSDSSIDDPAIIQKVLTAHQEARPEHQKVLTAHQEARPEHQKVLTAHQEARPEHTVSDGQCTTQNNAGPARRLEDELLKLFPTADDTALLLAQRLALSSQESDSGNYFPSGYLHTEQNEEPLIISTLDEHHKDTAPCMPPFVDNHLSMAPPSEVAHDTCNRESDVVAPYQNEQVPAQACDDVLSSGSTAPVCTSGPTVECGGVEGDLGFLKECFPDLEAGYLEELYQLCERDVEKAVSCVLGYPHTSRERGTEESSSVVGNTISQVPVATSDTDAKTATRQLLEYLQTDSGVPHSTWLRHRDKTSATDAGTLPDPDCFDDEAIARQLQQELDHEVQTLHTTNPPGPSQDEERITTNSHEVEAPVGDANLVLSLTPSLAQQLQEMFGSVTPLLPFPGTSAPGTHKTT